MYVRPMPPQMPVRNLLTFVDSSNPIFWINQSIPIMARRKGMASGGNINFNIINIMANISPTKTPVHRAHSGN